MSHLDWIFLGVVLTFSWHCKDFTHLCHFYIYSKSQHNFQTLKADHWSWCNESHWLQIRVWTLCEWESNWCLILSLLSSYDSLFTHFTGLSHRCEIEEQARHDLSQLIWNRNNFIPMTVLQTLIEATPKKHCWRTLTETLNCPLQFDSVKLLICNEVSLFNKTEEFTDNYLHLLILKGIAWHRNKRKENGGITLIIVHQHLAQKWQSRDKRSEQVKMKRKDEKMLLAVWSWN